MVQVQLHNTVVDALGRIEDDGANGSFFTPLEVTTAIFGRRAYPIVCDVNTAEIAFDNYGGRWGDPKQLDRFLQGYAVEKAKVEARKKGHTVTEQSLEDGSVKLTVNVGGAA